MWSWSYSQDGQWELADAGGEVVDPARVDVPEGRVVLRHAPGEASALRGSYTFAHIRRWSSGRTMASEFTAGRGEWVTNDKALLSRADLEEVDLVVAGMTADPQELVAGVAEVGRILSMAR